MKDDVSEPSGVGRTRPIFPYAMIDYFVYKTALFG